MRVESSVPFVTGKGRPRVSAGRAYTPRSTHDAQRAVAGAYRMACAQQHGRVAYAPEGVPVTVAIACERNVSSRLRKRDGDVQPDVSVPDADNVAKLVMDGLNGLAWADDAQVNEIHVYKLDRVRGTSPTTTVAIEWEE